MHASSARSRLHPVRFALAAAGVVAATALAVALPAAANGAPPASGPKPTIVLVHGAFADASGWNDVTERLQKRGYTVIAASNPLRGLTGDAEYVKSILATIEGPIVLVGHSYGGTVITNAATGDDQVKALVYDNAFIPDEGQTVLDLVHGGCFAVPDLSTVLNFVPIPGAPAEDVDTYVKPSVFPDCFANGLPAKQAAVLAATQRPLATAALGAPSGTPAWKTIPSWAIVGTDDHVIPSADQLAMANNAGADITKVKAPHLSMLSDPSVVVKVIEDAARSTRGPTPTPLPRVAPRGRREAAEPSQGTTA
jgi:pimeloyl-ACP methyl ester carboxylesterase